MSTAAPTVLYCQSTTASGTASLPSSDVEIVFGDIADIDAGRWLAVLIAEGNTTSLPDTATTVTITSGGSGVDTGWTRDADRRSGATQTGTNRVMIWSKVLTSADRTETAIKYHWGPTDFANSGTTRLQFMLIYHPDGWSGTAATRRIDVLYGSGSSITNATQYVDLTDDARPALYVAAFGSALVTNGTLTWDAESAREPYFDNNSGQSNTNGTFASGQYETGQASTQADFRTYAASGTPDKIVGSQGSANTTHAIAAVGYKPSPPAVALGTVAHTETAIAISHTRARAIGTVAATETAQAIAIASDTIALGTVAHTETAQALGKTKTAAVGTVTETSTAIAITAGRFAAVGTVDADDGAVAITWQKSATLTLGLSTPSGGAFATRTLRAWAWCVSSTDIADIRISLYQDTTAVTVGTWTPLTDTVTAYTLAIAGAITDYSLLRAVIEVRTVSSAVARVSQVELELSSEIGTVTETATVYPIGYSRARTIAVVAETNTANPIQASRSRALGTVTATETVYPITTVGGIPTRDLHYLVGAATAKWRAGAPTPKWSAGPAQQ